MGEMADWCNDQMQDAHPEWCPVGRDKPPPRCKYCGKSPLSWKELDSGWRLHNVDGSIHTCEEYKKKVP